MKVIPRCNMTTNALLLDRYMDFLVDKKFNLLISLDGDRFASSYRVDYNHENLYNKIIYNINLLRETYPDYYSKNVNFNAVLHNRNTEDGVYDYFNKEYQKEPFLSSLNPSGINPLKKDDFDKIQNKDYCMKKVISSNSRFKRKVLLEYSQFFYNNLFSYYSNYLDLLAGSSNTKWINPTATCLPFAKKIFVTVNGKIYPCEKIGQEHPLGIIQNNDVKIDFEEIANWYNGLYENIYKNECKGCSFFSNCVMCLYFFRDKKCPMNAHKDVFRKELKEKIDFLEQNRNLYLDLENTELR